MKNDEVESLYHYGVKGMRWGRRKARDEDRVTPRKPASDGPTVNVGTKADPVNVKANAKTSGKKGFGAESAKTLSDAELRARINRIKMEQEYSKLNKVDYGPAIKFIGNILGSLVTDAATAGVKRAASSAWEKKGAQVATQALGQVVRRQITG